MYIHISYLYIQGGQNKAWWIFISKNILEKNVQNKMFLQYQGGHNVIEMFVDDGFQGLRSTLFFLLKTYFLYAFL